MNYSTDELVSVEIDVTKAGATFRSYIPAWIRPVDVDLYNTRSSQAEIDAFFVAQALKTQCEIGAELDKRLKEAHVLHS